MNRFLGLFARRYIAGEGREDAISVAMGLNSHGILVSIDNLGEMVKITGEAVAAADEYIKLLEEIKETGIQADISLKLSHMGLDIGEEVCRTNLERVIKWAEEVNNFVWFDMERGKYTQGTLDIFFDLHKRHNNIGIAIQSYLKRSERDVGRLIEEGARVRLVKGAYKEPPEIAFPEKKDVDRNFELLMHDLLLRGNRPAIATHDMRLIEAALKFARENGIGNDRFEFQMLLGIKRTVQKRLAEEGYRMRVYIPYGPEWLPYITRRFKERKENVFFFIRNIFD